MPPEARKYLEDVQQACELLLKFSSGKSIADYQDAPMLRSGYAIFGVLSRDGSFSAPFWLGVQLVRWGTWGTHPLLVPGLLIRVFGSALFRRCVESRSGAAVPPFRPA